MLFIKVNNKTLKSKENINFLVVFVRTLTVHITVTLFLKVFLRSKHLKSVKISVILATYLKHPVNTLTYLDEETCHSWKKQHTH